MEAPLIPDPRNFKWKLLSNVLKIFDNHRVRKELSKSGITPVGRASLILKDSNRIVYMYVTVGYCNSTFKKLV